MNAQRAPRDPMGLEPFELVRADDKQAPQWLAKELAANVAFVREAVDNDVTLTDTIARSWVRGGSLGRHSVTEAVNDWIAHQWEFHNADPILISNVWKSFDADRMAAVRADAIKQELQS